MTLTVYDDTSGSSRVTKTVLAEAAPTDLAAFDAFDRVDAASLGSADEGGDWQIDYAPTPIPLDVEDQMARVKLSEVNGLMATVDDTSALDTMQLMGVVVDDLPVGAGATAVSELVTRVGTHGEYRGGISVEDDGSWRVHVMKDHYTLLGQSADLGTVEPGDRIHIAFEAIGTSPTVLRVMAWVDGESDPADWQIERTDSTADHQVVGRVGFAQTLYSGSTSENTMHFDTFAAYQRAS